MIRLWFDVVCPFAWLAARQLPAIAARAGVPLVWEPMLLGGVLKALGVADPNEAMSPAKTALVRADAVRQAALQGLTIRFPPGHPRRTVEAMRIVAGSSDVPAVANALWHAYWVEGADIADPAVLARFGTWDGDRDRLRRNTDRALAAGVFGAPGIEVDGRIYWGADRLWQVERALGLEPTIDPLGRSVPAGNTGRTITFWHDFSSPFSWLAATGIEALAARHGATVDWRPILLGGLFREVGQVDVPLLSYSAPRQDWTRRDLDRWAAERGVPLRFPSRFPVRTVLPLRVALLRPELTMAIYRAVWVDDRDVADPAVLASVVGDAEVVARAAEAKDALIANTREAAARGVIGVPSYHVGDTLIWGQDRFDHLARALA